MNDKIPTSLLQTYGAMRLSTRGTVQLEVDAIDCVRFHIHTPSQPGLNTQFVLAGSHLYDFEAQLARIVRAAKRHDRELKVVAS